MAKIKPENIPNKSTLYRWVHFEMYEDEDETLSPMTFENQDGGMSTDWSKHSSPNDTRERVRNFKPKREPKDYGVISLNVGKVRAIEKQIVEHTPKPSNLAHTDVFGDKSPKIKILYSRIYTWVIDPPKK